MILNRQPTLVIAAAERTQEVYAFRIRPPEGASLLWQQALQRRSKAL